MNVIRFIGLLFSVFRNTGQLCPGRFACDHPGALLAIANRCAALMPDI